MNLATSQTQAPHVSGVVNLGREARPYLIVETASFVVSAVAERRAVSKNAHAEGADLRRLDVLALALACLFVCSLLAAYLQF